MFQNINNDTMNINNENVRDDKEKLNLFSNVFAKKNFVLYVISFMLSLISVGGEFSLFSVSILGACIASSVPVLGVVVISLVGNLIKYGVGGALGYFLTTLVLLITLFIFKPKYNAQERNEKIKIGRDIFIATLLIQIVKLAISGFMLYDLLAGITISIISLVFYKIFVNSIVVIQDYGRKGAFSIEELLGTSLLIAIALGAFGDVSILGFGIRNVLSILLVMILGWKNGVLVGATSGVTIGVTLGVITGSEPIMIAAYAISGTIAGILNRFGKPGVIVGFALGNVVLAYVSNGYTIELIHFKEILLASIGLLAVPKTLHIELEEFIGNSKFLPVMPSRTLTNNKEVAENLNNVSEAIQEMASTYADERNERDNKLIEQSSATINANKQIFMAELLNNLEPYRENMLYEDIADIDGVITDKIFERLLDKQEINKADVIEIFANCNSYIIGFEDKEISEYLEENSEQIVRTINMSYKISKSDFLWKKKIEENNKTIQKQLNNVSKVIQEMAENIERVVETEEKYEQQREEILEILKQKNIEVEDVGIKKQGRYIVNIYINSIFEISKIEKIEQVLTLVLKEKMAFDSNSKTDKKLTYLSDDKYAMTLGKANAIKNKNDISGDSMMNIRLNDGKYLVAISDGMGSGKEANQSSRKALNMLENLLLSGFNKEVSLELINTTLMNQNEESFSTLDIAIIDLYAGTIEFIKNGACPTYIKNRNKVQLIKSKSLPIGILSNRDKEGFDKDIDSGDIMLMCSDGILDSNVEYKNKELWLKYILEDIETDNTQKIAELVLNEAIDNNYGMPKDDMSVIVCKFVKK